MMEISSSATVDLVQLLFHQTCKTQISKQKYKIIKTLL